MQIGGYFPYEELNTEPNGFLAGKTPENGELKYFMSGRCGIYYVLTDILPKDPVRTAYVPAYTCETVLAPFHKAGYQLIFYDVDHFMTPMFDPEVLNKISVVSICGYYGFSNYDRNFIAKCKERGIIIIEDTTHSIFSSDGIDLHCDYAAGSFRKWLGVPCGGFALKTHGKFQAPVLPADAEHVRLRHQCISLKNHFGDQTALQQEELMKKGNDLFWQSEMKLRRIFDAFASDEHSVHILEHYPVEELMKKRRENYQYLLDNIKKSDDFVLVFPSLPVGTVPSHLTLLCEERAHVQEGLLASEIRSTVYWPVGPLIPESGYENARYLYDHVLSIPCDQRYGKAEMLRIADALNSL